MLIYWTKELVPAPRVPTGGTSMTGPTDGYTFGGVLCTHFRSGADRVYSLTTVRWSLVTVPQT